MPKRVNEGDLSTLTKKKRSDICNEPWCTTRYSFGFLGQKASHCATHKKVGMVNVISKTCQNIGCTTQPTF